MIVLLHGALGSSTQLQPLEEALSAGGMNVLSLDFPGHGGQEIPIGGYSTGLFSDFLRRQLLEKAGNRPADIFGYSMGGYVATYMAAAHPGLIRSIITLGTKWEWSPEIASAEVKMLDAAKIREKVPAFARALEARHGKYWEDVLRATATMMVKMGENPPVTYLLLERVNIPVQIWRGKEDMMVSAAESHYAHSHIRNSTYLEWEGMPHPLEKCDTEKLAEAVIRFMGGLK